MKAKKQKGILYAVLAAMLLVVVLQSCKKYDNAAPVETVDVSIKFFNLPQNLNPAVQKIANKIKVQNNEKNFLDAFVKVQGYPIWDKAKITTVPLAYAPNIRFNSRASSSTTETEDFILVPLAMPNTNRVHGALSCVVKGDSVSIALIDGRKYKWYNDHPDSIGMNGEDVTLLMMQLDKAAFNHKYFKVKDSAAFGLSIKKSTRYITLTDSVSNSALPQSTRNGHWEYYFYMFSYVVYEPDLCGCDATPCPDGSMHEETKRRYITGTVWVEDDDWYYGNEGGGTGGGGVGGNSGGGNGDLPIDPVENDPITYTYQLSANDMRVINEINAEDQQSNDDYNNKDCDGTKRSGNMRRYGTIEHWIIELDYVSRNPVYGDMEYAIPQSSAIGNRGYADIVNKQTNEIFEIKPNNAEGLRLGSIEVDRYVQKAIANCPTAPGSFPPAWHAGTDYVIRYLPCTDPNKFLVAEKIANGVVGYKYVEKYSTPNPAPIAIPSSILDKVKELVGRLRNNVTDFDRIIAQYMKEHPELAAFIKGAAVGAAVSIVVGTIVEDFSTIGAGILDDFTSFQLAYRIVRFAWKL